MDKYEPKPPSIPTVGEKTGQLDDWISSEDPFEGRIDEDGDFECHEDHASR